jgi:hypothetical protein
VRVRWFYHAEETEGTGEGGRRIQDLSEPVGQPFGKRRVLNIVEQKVLFVPRGCCTSIF